MSASAAKLDWWGNVTFAVGLVAVLTGITYGIQPYGTHVMGWTSPTVLGLIIGGVVVLAGFVVIERRSAGPDVPHVAVPVIAPSPPATWPTCSPRSAVAACSSS